MSRLAFLGPSNPRRPSPRPRRSIRSCETQRRELGASAALNKSRRCHGRRRSQSVAAQLDGRGRRIHLAIVETNRSCLGDTAARARLGTSRGDAMVAERRGSRGPARTRATRPPRDRRDTRASAIIVEPATTPVSSSSGARLVAPSRAPPVPRRIVATRRPNRRGSESLDVVARVPSVPASAYLLR